MALIGKLKKALRQIGVGSGERRADFAFSNGAIEDAVQRPIAELDRIVSGRELVVQLDARAGERYRSQHKRNNPADGEQRGAAHPPRRMFMGGGRCWVSGWAPTFESHGKPLAETALGE